MASKYAGARSSASAGVPVPRVLHEERSESFRHSRHLRHTPLNLAARCRPHLVINQRNIIEDLGAAIRIESRQLRNEMWHNRVGHIEDGFLVEKRFVQQFILVLFGVGAN